MVHGHYTKYEYSALRVGHLTKVLTKKIGIHTLFWDTQTILHASSLYGG